MNKIADKIEQLFAQAEIIELSHMLEERMSAAPGHNYYFSMPWNSPEAGDLSTSHQLIINEHTGTHVDAPAHFIREGSEAQTSIEKMPVKKFLCPCRVIKLKGLAGGDVISRQMITDHEESNGAIKRGEGVLFHTGWDKYWSTRPNDALFVRSWPGIGRDAAKYLADKGIKLIGTDCLSIDSSSSNDFPAHNILLGNGIPVFENLANLSYIEDRCFLMALPLCIKGGTASPVRVIAIL